MEGDAAAVAAERAEVLGLSGRLAAREAELSEASYRETIAANTVPSCCKLNSSE